MRRRFTVPFVLATTPFVLASLANCRSATVLAAQNLVVPAAQTPPLLPTPPRQTTPWTPPTGKDAEGLPLPLLSATQTLFVQGLADPRDGEYRVITVQIGNVWQGDGGIVETHGWVLPGGTEQKRFAVCWNGLVYPVVAVKERADLQADVQTLVATHTDFQKKSGRGPDFTMYWGNATPEGLSLALEYPSLLKAVYLLRLGRYDLARTVYALWESGTPPRVNGNSEILRDPYLLLATQWAWSAYDRAVCAHMRGADALAVADTTLLTRIQPLIESEALKRAYKTTPRGGIHKEGTPFLAFLDNLPALQQDSVRRVAQTARPALDITALRKLPQNERITELIRRLDEIQARQSGQPGGVGLDADPIAEALIAEGDDAIALLLDVMEKDDRLTRSVSFGRDFFQQRNLLTVRSAAFACFARITDVTEIGEGKRSVTALREWWTKNMGASPAERWFAQLADNGSLTAAPAPSASQSREERDQNFRQQSERAHNDRNRWTEAASRIVERNDVTRSGGWVSVPSYEPGHTLPPFKGEPLRGRQSPSVSDLLRQRALQISEPTPNRWGFDFAGAATFALMLYEWDPAGSDTLPTLQEVMRRCLVFQNGQTKGSGHSDQYGLGERIARLTVARLRRGDAAAATEYGDWLRTVSPDHLGFETGSALFALWKESENPAMRRVGDALFSEDGASPTAWSRLLTDQKSRDNAYSSGLLASDLIRLPAFRALVARRLRNTAPAGFVTQNGDDFLNRQLAWQEGSSQGPTPPPNSTLRRQPLRICDRCALELQSLDGVPRFDPFAPVAERDKLCAAITAYLDRYGAQIGRADREAHPLYGRYSGSRFDYLGPIFPAATRPATEADVRENRAVFSLRGENVRLVSDLPASLPLEARWATDPAPEFASSNGKTVPWSRGLIWQAEEVFEAGKWVRYYGYVGPHSVARVPAEEILITDYRAAQKPPAAATKQGP